MTKLNSSNRSPLSAAFGHRTRRNDNDIERGGQEPRAPSKKNQATATAAVGVNGAPSFPPNSRTIASISEPSRTSFSSSDSATLWSRRRFDFKSSLAL